MKRRFTILTAALALLACLAIPMGVMGQAPVNTVLWGETWTGATTATSGNDNATPSANYGHGTTVYNNGTVTYTQSANTVYVRNDNLAGGVKPELLLSSGKTWTISDIPTGEATELTLTYKSNNTKSSVTCSTSGASISGSSPSYTITTGSASTITLVFGCSGNTRIDDVELKVKTAGGTPSYTITAQSNNNTYGTVSLFGSVITATPATGYRVSSSNPYSVSPSGSATVSQNGNEFTVTPSANTTVTINFEAIPTHTVTMPSADNYGTYTMSPSNPVPYGTEVTLIFTPATGYEAYAASWSVNGTPISGNVFTMPDENVTVTVTLAEAIAEFINGVYTENMTTQASFDNWRPYSVSGDQGWVFGGSNYGAKISGYVNPTNYENEDWYISPKMQVENGKLDISFACVGRYGEAGMITIWYSTDFTGVLSAATWTEITPDQDIPYNASNWNFQNITCSIEQTGNVYFAFKYVSTTESAGTFEVKNFAAKQYYNVIFDANDENATGTMAPLSCVAGVAKALTENAFEVSGKVFNGWNTQSDGSGTTYADGANISITQNTTLYAQWADVYAVTFMANGNLVDTKNVKQGDPIGTLPTVSASYIPEGYEFMGWHVGDYFSENMAPEYVSASYPPTGDITLKAVFAQVTSSGSSTGTLTGDEIASEFANEAQAYADPEKSFEDGDFTWAARCITNKDRHWIQLKSDNNVYIKIVAPSGIQSVEVSISNAQNQSGGIDDITMHGSFDASGHIYLNTTNGGDHVGTTSGSVVENYVATVVPTGDYNTLYLQVDKGARIWGLTVTCASVSYSNYCTSYYTKTIVGRTTGGYQLIASPIGQVAPANVTNMTANSFDLYRFNANAALQWENYKQVGDDHYHFNLEPGRGYLYANSETVDLVFTGQEYSGDALEVTLNAQSANGFQNWNLVGNPFAEIAHIETEEGHTLNYYTVGVKGGQTNQYIAATNTSIQPMEGVFVIAIENGETITFARGESKTRSSHLALNINSSRNLVDRAIVRFDECRQLPKFQLNEDYTKVYIPMDGEEYAVVHGEEMGELPVNFKAEENGHYSLNLSSENVEFAYLHLIDNMTGNEVDLLQTPNYSFEAKTTDYASRFKLVYATGNNSNDDTFAFYSNGSFVINNDGIAELQVVDIMGRILSSETINGCSNVSVNAAPGVYMLRLVNGTDVKTQKVVVK